MTRLDDAFDDLIASYPPGDPDALLASARREVAAGPDRRRSRLVLAAAAAVLAAAALATALIAFRNDPDAHLRTGPGPTTTEVPPASRTVRVYFSKDEGDGCKRVEAVERPVPVDQAGTVDGRTLAALRELFDGPTAAEAERGLTSPFDGAGDTVRSVTTADGYTTIDLDRRIIGLVSNASTACTSGSIEAELSATLSVVDGLTWRRITMDGDPDAFYAWLGIEPPHDGPFATTTTAAPRVPAGAGAGYAVASVLGVTLRTGTDQTTGIGISRNPAASAYAIGTDLVVFQGTDADVDTTVPPIPPPATGAIWVWAKDQGTVRLPVDAGADQAILLDAAVLDGSPTALVALRSGDTPDTARERLVLVDLDTRRIRPVIDIAAWEAGHHQARLLPDGDVVGLLSAEGRTSLVRWTAGSNGPVWSVETDATANEAIAVRGDRAVLVDDPPPRSGSLRIRTIDLEGGDLGTPTTIGVGSDDLWCSDWYDDDELSCAHNGSAGAVDERGAWRGLETPTGAVVTPSR